MNTDGYLPEKSMKSVLTNISTALSLRKNAAELKQFANDDSKKAFIEEAIEGLEDYIMNLATFSLRSDIVVITATKDESAGLEVINTMPELEQIANTAPVSGHLHS